MLEAFLLRYGYVALFIGTIVEGEFFILPAGFLAHRGYFGFPAVLVIATLGAFVGDIVYFSLGRHYGRAFILRRKHAAAAIPRLEEFLRQHDTLFLFLVRYVWGIRWAAAGLAGASKLPFARFAVIDLAACLVWAITMASAGYLAGEAIQTLAANVHEYEVVALVGLAIGSAGYAWFWYRRGLHGGQ